MSSRPKRPVSPVAIALWLMVLAVGVGCIAAASAHAAFYDVVFCAGGNGSGNPTLGARPGGFDFGTDCGESPSYPSEGNHYLRLNENTTGMAGAGDEASMSWYAPPGTSIVAGGGYTREPNAFNEGWRARFWGEDWGGGVHNVMLQGSGGIEGTGEFPWITKNTTSIFASHLWPYGGWDDYKRFVFGLACVRPGGCDRANFNAVDANTITLVADDHEGAQVAFEDGATVRGEWVRGYQVLAWRESDQGSGLRFSRLGTDGSTFPDGTIDDQANGGCRIGYRDGGREFGKGFQPCTPGPYLRYYGFETKNVPDGQHTLAICLQDYAQYINHAESCDRRTIHTDNTAPGKPASLEVTSANPQRYLDHFGAKWSLPPDPGSPIAKVHYDIVDATGKVVVPEKTVSATNPTALSNIQGPAKSGAYTLRVWLEDSVGFVGAAADAPIPHDTTPPAAPQSLRVAGPGTRWVDNVDLRWQDIVDAGSPIDEAHYQVLDASGNVVGGTHAIGGTGVQALDGIQAPPQRGNYSARVWLSDEEGNVGAPASVPLPRDTTPPAAPQDLSVASPGTSRAAEGFDVRWRNVTDDGSPIDAAHYEILSGSGRVAVPATTVSGANIQAIADLQTPRDSGGYTLRLWLSDEEGNVGAPVSIPLSYDCVRSDAGGATDLSAGLGDEQSSDQHVGQGQGTTLTGHLRGPGGPVADASVCVFDSVLIEGSEREFLGIALTGDDGGYRFAIAPGPSRAIGAIYRPGQRQLNTSATLYTRVRPTLKAESPVVRNKRVAHFYGQIPGPYNDRVVVVLQVKQSEGWRVFRRYRTRGGGRYQLAYRFGRTTSPATYVMRAQVRRQGGYPYLPGNSKPLRLRVMP